MFASSSIPKTILVLWLLQGTLVYSQYDNSYEDSYGDVYDDDDIEELVIDEVQDVHVKQKILVDRSYNSSFTVSIPMLSVVVPGTAKANGVVRLTISHITMWSLISLSFLGLVYPALLGPFGKLHKRGFEEDNFRIDPTILDHINDLIDVQQVYKDVESLVPWEATQDCMKRSICEAHENVVEFGLAGLALRGAFSMPDYNEDDRMDKDTSGRSRRSAMTCAEKYPRCVVSPLDLYKETLEYFFEN